MIKNKSSGSSKNHRWMLTYASLITALLAFFIFFVFKAEEAVESKFRVADLLKNNIYIRVLYEKHQKELNWLHVENTGTKGVKLLIPSTIVDASINSKNVSMFDSGDDIIKTDFEPYINSVVEVIHTLRLEQIPSRYSQEIQYLNSINKDIRVDIVIEGHTDRRTINNTRFKDNWELSIARAGNVMALLQEKLQLPYHLFSIAGYGPFHPLRDQDNLEENRRVEIYINAQMVSLNGNNN